MKALPVAGLVQFVGSISILTGNLRRAQPVGSRKGATGLMSVVENDTATRQGGDELTPEQVPFPTSILYDRDPPTPWDSSPARVGFLHALLVFTSRLLHLVTKMQRDQHNQ